MYEYICSQVLYMFICALVSAVVVPVRNVFSVAKLLPLPNKLCQNDDGILMN